MILYNLKWGDFMRNTEKLSDEYLCINHCDHEKDYLTDVVRLRENGCIDYLLLYPVKGYFYIIENNEKIKIEAGNIVLYRPHEKQHYIYEKNTDSFTYYIHFTGTICEHYIKRLGFDKGRYFNVGISNTIIRLIEKIIREEKLQNTYYNDINNGYLAQILSLLGRHHSNLSLEEDYIERSEKISEICLMMHKEYASNKKPSDYAKLSFLSESKFYKAFKQTKGISPGQYLLNIRLSKAEEMLDCTDLSINEICNMTGFSDQNYFSRVFKKHTKLTPSQYRHKFK